MDEIRVGELLTEASMGYEPDDEAMERNRVALAALIAAPLSTVDQGAGGAKAAGGAAIIKKGALFALGLGLVVSGVMVGRHLTRGAELPDGSTGQVVAPVQNNAHGRVFKEAAREVTAPVRTAPVVSNVEQPQPAPTVNLTLKSGESPRAHGGAPQVETGKEKSGQSKLVTPSNGEEPIPAVSAVDEMKLIRKIAAAQRAGKTGLAFSLIGAHEQQFSNGLFVSEREGLRVLTLCAAGRVDESERRRAKFLAAYPNAPIAARLQKTCEGGAR